jgi:hypothetical protein
MSGYGLWAMDYGLWVMGYGLWTMGYGLWAMDYGLWAMGYGLDDRANPGIYLKYFNLIYYTEFTITNNLVVMVTMEHKQYKPTV